MSASNVITRDDWSPPRGNYVEPKWRTLRIRCVRPFYWREEIRLRGRVLPAGPTRLLEIGEVVEAIEPEARSLVASGKAELV